MATPLWNDYKEFETPCQIALMSKLFLLLWHCSRVKVAGLELQCSLLRYFDEQAF